MVIKIPGLENIDMEAINSAVEQAVASAGVGQLDLGSLGTSGQSVMEGEPVTLAADPVAPVFDTNDVAGSLAAGLVPTQADIVNMYAPYVFGSKVPEKTFNEIRALEEAGYPLIIDGKQYAPTSTISHIQDGKFIPKTVGTDYTYPSVADTVITGEPEVTPMDSDIDRAVATAVASAMASGGDMLVQAADDPIMTAVETAVGSGQPTTDDTILTEQAMTSVPTETTQVAQEAQPDFMTQINELIAQMQAEQTAAAAAQQQQAAEMAQNYMVGQPAVGYNPYESGQYQNNPYGAAGVPDMGGITSIPVPAAYTPNPYLIGGTT
tara:strand:+ start:1329 stop:2294 length:966 start_codon:yes stop_codon:yes gene_type:complete